MWLFRIFTALAFDIVTTLILVFMTLYLSEAWYINHSSINNSIKRGNDLGTILFGATLAYYVFFISFPVLFILFFKLIKKYLKDN